MKRLAVVIISLTLATAALADDTRQYTNCHGLWLPVDECENSQLEAGWYSPKTVQPYDDHSVTPSSYYDVGSDDIIPLLEQCLEFVPDGSDIVHEPQSNYMPLFYIEPHSTIEPGPISKAQAELDRLKAQTELNHKIKEILRILKGENQ